MPREETTLDHDEGLGGLRRGGECPEGGAEEWSRGKRADNTDEDEIDILGQLEGGP